MEENIYNLPTMRPARYERLEGLLRLVDERAESDYRFNFPNYADGPERHVGRSHAMKLVEIDPTASKKFVSYLSYLYLQSGEAANNRLLFEDNAQAAAYLWAIEVLQGSRIPISLDKSNSKGNPVFNDNGLPSVLSLADVFDKIQPYNERLRRSPACQNIGDLDEELAYQIKLLVDPKPQMTQFGVGDPEERDLLLSQNPSAVIIHQSDDFKFVKINDRKAARYYGRGTEWCTGWEHTHTHVDRYLSRGHLYALFIRNSKQAYQGGSGGWHGYQFHFNDWQLTDEYDRESKLLDVYNTFDKKDHWEQFAGLLIGVILNDAEDGLRLPNIPKELVPYINGEHRARNAEVELALTDAKDRQVRHKAFENLRANAAYLSSDQRELHLAKLEEHAGKLWHHLHEEALKFLTPADRDSYTRDQQKRMLAIDLAISENSAEIVRRKDKSQPPGYIYVETG